MEKRGKKKWFQIGLRKCNNRVNVDATDFNHFAHGYTNFTVLTFRILKNGKRLQCKLSKHNKNYLMKLTHNNLFERIALIGNLEKIKQLQLKGMECSIEH